ncbi:unnamed protein product, partial [Urochloa humidicola]
LQAARSAAAASSPCLRLRRIHHLHYLPLPNPRSWRRERGRGLRRWSGYAGLHPRNPNPRPSTSTSRAPHQRRLLPSPTCATSSRTTTQKEPDEVGEEEEERVAGSGKDNLASLWHPLPLSWWTGCRTGIHARHSREDDGGDPLCAPTSIHATLPILSRLSPPGMRRSRAMARSFCGLISCSRPQWAPVAGP